jgi:hypothetical protein
MTRKYWLGALIGMFATSACGDDTTTQEDDDTGTTTGMTTTGLDDATETTATTSSTTVTTMMTSSTTDVVDESSGGDLPDPEPADFLVRIENISDSSIMPITISPGVWLEQDQNIAPPIFTENSAAPGNGIRALAEDGDPTELAGNLGTNNDLFQSGVLDTPVGETDPGPIAPGEAYEVTFTAQPYSRLGLAAMFEQSNDMFIGTAAPGVGLFQNNGQPRDFQNITAFLRLWDAGTEVNQAPGQGPDQGWSQEEAGQGARESGVVTAFSSSTRAVPLPGALVEVAVSFEEGTYTIELTNISLSRGTLVTALSPMFWALHDDSVALFTPGEDAPNGLEALAEDGDPSELETNLASATGVGASGTTAGMDPGESVVLTLTPDDQAPLLSFATMLAETNDAFIAPLPSGIALLDDQGQPRSANAVRDDLRRKLAVWDAGTEANEVPGVGPNQMLRQADPGDGEADPDSSVRLYSDATNDLAGANAGGFLAVEIIGGDEDDEFVVRVTNTSGDTVYPGILTPVVWAVHDDTAYLFEDGMPASPGLEELAEDGETAGLLAELDSMAGVLQTGVADLHDAAEPEEEGPLPLQPGESYSFTIMGVNADERYFSLATMIAPSNDTFAAFGPLGIALWDDNGPLSDDAIADNVAAALRAWDAGTEANQAGAAGRDMAPMQAAPNTGVPEGTGVVRQSSTDPIWDYPYLGVVVRVTIEHQR